MVPIKHAIFLLTVYGMKNTVRLIKYLQSQIKGIPLKRSGLFGVVVYLDLVIFDSLHQACCPTSNKLVFVVVLGNVHTLKYGAIWK